MQALRAQDLPTERKLFTEAWTALKRFATARTEDELDEAADGIIKALYAIPCDSPETRGLQAELMGAVIRYCERRSRPDGLAAADVPHRLLQHSAGAAV